MEEKKDEVIDERKKKILRFFSYKKEWIFLVLLLLLLAVAWHIRTVNVPNLKDVTTNDYTLGPDLDPFLFLRYAKLIITTGSIPEVDYMRYVPLGYKTISETKLLPYMMAYYYKILNFFNPVSINYSAVLFPAFMFLLTAIAFFLLIREIFYENKHRSWIAIVSTAFLIVAPALLPRTIAGIPEKESVGFFFLFLALYFFIKAWKNKSFYGSLIIGLLAGVSTAMMGLVWGGWIYIFITIAIFTLVNFILGRIEKRELLVYGIWLISSFFIATALSNKYSLLGLVKSTTSGISLAVLILILVDFVIWKTNIKKISFIEKLQIKLPEKIISLIAFALIGLILATIFIGPSFIYNFFSSILFHLTQPYVDRISFTVAENKQPFFDEWGYNFLPIISGIPIFFWIFFIGSIFLFYELVKHMQKKGKLILTFAYIIFIVCLVFSRFSSSSMMNGENGISKIVYFGGMIFFAGAIIYLYYIYKKENKLEEFNKIDLSYLLLLAYFLPSLVGARSAIRLLMALVPPVAGIAGFFIVSSIEKVKIHNESTMKLMAILLASILVIASAYVLYVNYKLVISSAQSMTTNSAYTIQWQKAMAWVRDNTPKSAVFAHWWDYGYWLQSIGERATVLDGGNSIPYWDYLMGRYGLTGQSEDQALEFFYSHNATYFLIDSSDIGKYPAYSSIGSDENYDRYSWIGTYILDENQVEEKKNETVYIYYGGTALDQDYEYVTNSTKTFFPAQKTGIGAMILTMNNEGKGFKQPEAVFVYQNNQYRIPLRYVFFQGKMYDFNTGYNGVFYIMPSIVQGTNGLSVNNFGASLFLSERNMKALWVQLYLLNNAKNFELVHSETNLIVQNIRDSGNQIGDFVYYQGVQGPIKIWKINYKGTEKVNQEYLLRTYPENLQGVILAKN